MSAIFEPKGMKKKMKRIERIGAQHRARKLNRERFKWLFSNFFAPDFFIPQPR